MPPVIHICMYFESHYLCMPALRFSTLYFKCINSILLLLLHGCFILYIYLSTSVPLSFILLLVSVLSWVPCEVASWLKASLGEIRFPYHTIHSISNSQTSSPVTTPYFSSVSASVSYSCTDEGVRRDTKTSEITVTIG